MKFLFLFLSILPTFYTYKYLTLYKWKSIKKILNDNDEVLKQVVKTEIYNDYKIRTIKRCNRFLQKNNIIDEDHNKIIINAGLLGLKESINTYNSTIKYNFAKYSDKHIDKNLKIIDNYLIYKKRKNLMFNEKNYIYYKWWNTYWTYINNDLHPEYAQIIKSKYTCDFKKIKSNNELAIMYKTTSSNITEIITTSLRYVYKKIQNENLLAEQFMLNTVFF